MLIPVKELMQHVPNGKLLTKGIIHVGANTGQEADMYCNMGLTDQVWIEAIPDVHARLIKNLKSKPYIKSSCIKACVSNVVGEEVEFNVSNNDAQSSSFLQLGTHKQVHPEVHYIRSFKAVTTTLDTLFMPTIASMDYKFLAMDVQGAELKVLQGATQLLKQIQYVYAEVNKEELYKGCALIGDLDDLLLRKGFHRMVTVWAGDTGWGDAFYVRSNKD